MPDDFSLTRMPIIIVFAETIDMINVESSVMTGR